MFHSAVCALAGTDIPEAQSNTEPQWPPRSPREALLSTPKGRERYKQILEQTSPSPSPSKASRTLYRSPQQDISDDDDEETLQLKLQAIQARLKLKKLQNAKSAAAATKPSELDVRDSKNTTGQAGSRNNTSISASATAGEARNGGRSSALPPVEVPASPVRKLQAPQAQTSPSRVLLGIDKGLRAKDVSLKRAPSFKRPQPGREANPPRESNTTTASSHHENIPRPQSFNERLASVRTEEVSRAERQKRIQQVRTNAFGIGQAEMEKYKSNAVEIPNEPLAAPAFSREDIMSHAKAAGSSRGEALPTSRVQKQAAEDFKTASKKASDVLDNNNTDASASFEPYSAFHLSRRILPHLVVTRHISNAKAFSIKDLLKSVKAPDFALPDLEQNIVVFAIIAKKSEPRSHKPVAGKKGAPAEDRGKYMVMTLVDLDFELELFLFNSGFNRFWKLSEGTVVAILNPNIMPPPPGRQDTGRFSLVINSDADTILEIGTARDLGFCESVKKDGSLCGAWVNKKKTQFCEFHSNEALRKRRATRIEVNTNSFGFSGEKWHKYNSREIFTDKKPESNRHYDKFTQSNYFKTRSMSAADLIDGKDVDPLHRQERAEFVKRGLEAKEKEREIMKKLGSIGNAAGKEYMQRAGSRTANGPGALPSTQSSASMEDSEGSSRATAESLGLLSRDRTIHLSPIKRKRPDSSRASSTASVGKPGFGWGSSLKDKLSKMKEGEKLHKEEAPPVRKKTRFVTEKGIREAGRESLGVDLSERQVSFGNDDDDELVIV
ncbi:minichromosome maintenance 10 [Paramyrothecium foliicola]|nr:minichromosome maintenance 10 [Paramyrothecium foliicola]